MSRSEVMAKNRYNELFEEKITSTKKMRKTLFGGNFAQINLS